MKQQWICRHIATLGHIILPRSTKRLYIFHCRTSIKMFLIGRDTGYDADDLTYVISHKFIGEN